MKQKNEWKREKERELANAVLHLDSFGAQSTCRRNMVFESSHTTAFVYKNRMHHMILPTEHAVFSRNTLDQFSYYRAHCMY